MNFQHTANNLASQGRNGDSMLMHVTPREVSGLQALAQQHGGSLTVNPQTGLPEANILDDIGLGEVNKFVPAIAGAGLSFFSGGAIDPITAAGMVGGLAGLSSGSLKEGIMAGLGAYGGASMTGALGAMGGASNATAAAQAADAGATGPLSGAAFNNVASAPDVGAGFNAATGSFGAAKDFLKNNKWAIGAAALPALESSMEQPAAVGPLKNKGYIRRYEKNPETGALEQVEAVPVDEWGDRPAVSFGGAGKSAQYAAGGAVAFDAGGPVTFGGVGASTNVRDPNDTRTDSQKAYDYLMGVPGAKNPMMFRHAAPVTPVTPVAKPATDTTSAAALAEAGLAGLEAQQQKLAAGGSRVAPSEPGIASGRLGEYGAVAGNLLGTAGLIALGKIANTFGLGDTTNYNPSVSDAQGTPTTSADKGMGMAPGIEGADNPSGFGVGLGDTPADASTGIASLSTANQSQATQAQAQAQAETQARQAAEQAARETQAREAAAQAQAKALAEQSAAESARLAAKEQAAQAAAQAQAQAQAEQSAREQAAREAARAVEAQMAAQAQAQAEQSAREQAQAQAQAAADQSAAESSRLASQNAAAQAASNAAAAANNANYGNEGRNSSSSDNSGAATNSSDNGGWGSRDAGGNTGEARGGLNLRGKYFPPQYAQGGIAALAAGGLGSLGGYSDGGQLLKGPGDGVSDSIPATIGKGQPARLADGEFVVPARIVSELGNGSTEAGAKQLYAMMARIQAGRAKTTGKNKVATNSKAARHLPA